MNPSGEQYWLETDDQEASVVEVGARTCFLVPATTYLVNDERGIPREQRLTVRSPFRFDEPKPIGELAMNLRLLKPGESWTTVWGIAAASPR